MDAATRLLKYPALVPLHAQEDLEVLIQAQLGDLTEDNLHETLRHLNTVIWETLFAVAQQAPAWSVADFYTTCHALIEQLKDEAYYCLHKKYAVLIVGGAPPPAPAVTLETFRDRVATVVDGRPAGARYEAMLRQLAPTSPPRTLMRSRKCPRCAEWLRARMREAGVTTAGELHRLAGMPSAKSIRTILAGDQVTDPVLERLAQGVSVVLKRRVTFAEIPQD